MRSPGDWLSRLERRLHTAEVMGSSPVSPTGKEQSAASVRFQDRRCAASSERASNAVVRPPSVGSTSTHRDYPVRSASAFRGGSHHRVRHRASTTAFLRSDGVEPVSMHAFIDESARRGEYIIGFPTRWLGLTAGALHGGGPSIGSGSSPRSSEWLWPDAQDPAAHRPERSRAHFLGLVPSAVSSIGCRALIRNNFWGGEQVAGFFEGQPPWTRTRGSKCSTTGNGS